MNKIFIDGILNIPDTLCFENQISTKICSNINKVSNIFNYIFIMCKLFLQRTFLEEIQQSCHSVHASALNMRLWQMMVILPRVIAFVLILMKTKQLLGSK